MARSLLAAAAAVIALGGCGGDGDGATATQATTRFGGTRDAATTTTRSHAHSATGADVRRTLSQVLVVGDCTDFVTAEFVQRSYGDRSACVKAIAAGGTASSLDVRAIALASDEATAVVIPRGGPSSGDRLIVRLVRTGDTWKVDSLESNAPVGP